MNYYNDNDPHAAAWLRELIKKGLIPDGEVDERSIADVEPRELSGYVQCHFFAGIAGWLYALRLAGWPDDRPVWTGSCPCQPFSAAGKGAGVRDERHLWPAFRWLIAQRRPATVFGEQVASRAGREWLSGVRLDLEAMEYAVGAADLCAAGVGAPHIRQRLWWVADAKRNRQHRAGNIGSSGRNEFADGGVDHRRVNAIGQRQQKQCCSQPVRAEQPGVDCGVENVAGERCGEARKYFERSTERVAGSSSYGWVSDSERTKWREISKGRDDINRDNTGREEAAGGFAIHRPWDEYELIYCADGKHRRIEPGSLPLVDGFPGRVGLLRGYGNAIVPQVAAEFIKAFMGC